MIIKVCGREDKHYLAMQTNCYQGIAMLIKMSQGNCQGPTPSTRKPSQHSFEVKFASIATDREKNFCISHQTRHFHTQVINFAL